ncbi:MAG: sigma-70 family RNA polymerase sigma factor [Acidobacteria bacterium]|nr:sigma-70 family RNA polymerase sigma factor [Acidobacteriota bacterium]NIM63567.1 sigma-70 family RNA polymerase sigma factor [Acidobacteriota bacterium]NIO58429.1 sigma-70 family RNA polymerase sigma factor [Acidobacteriota bacterium]NIQ29484.1 sigma-70 family RNA polymerase sigma factor [Acidobacteriota bacterium]NIQ84161.1 sigma-70 family RNA polymerase sigma factor [Acidobacteriota bacterium]
MPDKPPHDRKAEFEETALEYLTPLFNLALNLTRNRKDAEDLVQETYLRAYRFFDSYQPGTHIKAWLFRILRNTFINRYRAEKVRPDEVDFSKVEQAYERVVDEHFLQANRPVSPEDALMAGVLDEEIETAMARLPEEYRSVVILALVEELPYKEIAATLSIPLGTVMSRLHRGRKLLQTQLLEYARKKGILSGPARVANDEDAAS